MPPFTRHQDIYTLTSESHKNKLAGFISSKKEVVYVTLVLFN